MRIPIRTNLLVTALAWTTSSFSVLAADVPRLVPTARQVDKLLAEEMVATKASQAPRCNDETYVRRVFLDLQGAPPAPEEVVAFSVDPDPNKRGKLVARLLQSEAFGKNWARYWRDTILYRRSEDRALFVAGPLEDYLAEHFNKNTPWDKVAASFLTAKGDVKENGATGLIMAQAGRPEETVAEISRIFMGIQIQCAQCHDHPTDSWTRTQFHQLAAFFPRVAVQPRLQQDRTFLVTVTDRSPRFQRRNNNNRFRGTLEHHMPDLERPEAKGEQMQPVFFVTGQKLTSGTRDALRRESLSNWMTSAKNPWFAKAYVNRMWSELVGEGFYEPVDDIGPERECSATKTLDHLSRAFRDTGYDVQWLFRTIMHTNAYQRSSRSRRRLDEAPFQANVNQRLRGDELFSCLLSAVGASEPPVRNASGAYRRASGPRVLFNQAFGYDPSARRDEVTGSIPQALLMMNSPIINQAITARPGNQLSRLLNELDDDAELASELYLRTLSRSPTDVELKTCLNYVKEVGDRREAFEDIVWSLVNSTEFLHRR